MKNIFLTITVVAIVIGNMAFYASSQIELNYDNGTFSLNDEYKVIKINEIPSPVTDSISTDFVNAFITKVYVNDTKEYKLELAIDGSREIVYTNAKGELLNK